MELPKDKQPPRSIWHNEYKLNQWFKEVLNTAKSDNTQGMVVDLDEVD